MSTLKLAFAATIAIGLAQVVTSTAAEAKCTRLAFSVNDYGKEGPTRDAKNLLDKYIAKWTAENGIKTYRTGKKDVTCELFLDFGFFDEWTCKAAATVCWPDGQGPQQTVAPAEGSAPGSQKAARKNAAEKGGETKSAPAKSTSANPAAQPATAPVSTGSVTAPAPAPAKKE